MTTKPKIHMGVLITGMLCLTAVELFNLALGHNGLYLSIFVGLMAGAMGLALPQFKLRG